MPLFCTFIFISILPRGSKFLVKYVYYDLMCRSAMIRISRQHKGNHGSLKENRKGVYITLLFEVFFMEFRFMTKASHSWFYGSVREISDLFVVGRPDMTIVAFGSDVIDIFEVNDIMSSKGWHLNALQRPNR